MNTQRSSGGSDGIRLDVGLEFHKTIDYDRRAMRKALRQGGAAVRKEARRMVSRKAVSSPGEAPGMQTGVLRRAIGIIKVGSRGGWVRVGPKTLKGRDFYPAFLFYGSTKTGLEKRGNYMETALITKRDEVRSHIRAALKDSLVPR